MTAGGLIVITLVMLAGLAGVVVPFLPGLALIWAAALVWVLEVGTGAGRWVVLAVITVLLAVGTLAQYVLPARRARGTGAPRTTLAAGVVGALVGFVVIPVAGLVVGGLGGIYLAELARRRDAALAWSSTKAVLVGIGVGVLVELAAGMAMILSWVVGVALVQS